MTPTESPIGSVGGRQIYLDVTTMLMAVAAVAAMAAGIWLRSSPPYSLVGSALKAIACLLAYWAAVHTVLRLCGYRVPITGWRRKDRIAMYRLGFWRYIVFVWIIDYSVGMIILVAALHYFHNGAVDFSLAENALVWLFTGLLVGVLSYKSSTQQ